MKYCESYAALLDLFVDGELSLEEMLDVQAHLDECPACRAYVDDALAMRAAFPGVEDTEVPEGFAAGVMAAIQADSAARPAAAPRKKKRTPWVGVVASLAACCAIVILQQNGPLSMKSESAAASMAYDTAVAEEAVCDDAATEYVYTTADPAAEETAEETAEDAMAEAEKNAPMERQTEVPAEGGAVSHSLTDAAAAAPTAEEPAEETAPDVWEEGQNVMFACVVFLPADRVGSVLDEYEGKPYVTEEGIVGTGYAMGQNEFERILYDAFDYTHGPELDPERTTDLCCIVVTE